MSASHRSQEGGVPEEVGENDGTTATVDSVVDSGTAIVEDASRTPTFEIDSSDTDRGQPAFTVMPAERQRVVVLTDISNEPDDAMSMVRFLLYTDELDVEGLIATTSCWLKDAVRPDLIDERIKAFGQVRDNLVLHASGWPVEADLRRMLASGQVGFGMSKVGDGRGTTGSQRIIDAVDRPDARPVWVSIWGGANTLAQALWDVRKRRSPSELDTFVAKLGVYAISDQDDAGAWIRREFPNLFYVVSPSHPDQNGGADYAQATWDGFSGDNFKSHFAGPDYELVNNSRRSPRTKIPTGSFPRRPHLRQPIWGSSSSPAPHLPCRCSSMRSCST